MTLVVQLKHNGDSTEFWFESWTIPGVCDNPNVLPTIGHFPDNTSIEEAIQIIRDKTLEWKRAMIAFCEKDIPLIERAEYKPFTVTHLKNEETQD